jgi:hypothetical protein
MEKVRELENEGFAVPQPFQLREERNIVPIYPDNKRTWPEFGDFRIELEKSHIAIELDSGGIDLTNLLTHWHYLCKHFNEPPVNGKSIILLHVYTQKEGDDLRSRVICWDFLYSQILQNLPRDGCFKAYRYPIHLEDGKWKEQDIQDILNAFVAYIYKTVPH